MDCTGCIEGAMKGHPKYESTKPLVSDKPGKITAAYLMFVEGNQMNKTKEKIETIGMMKNVLFQNVMNRNVLMMQ